MKQPINDLLSCPFCGTEAHTLDIYIHCGNKECPLWEKVFESKYWNTRVSPSNAIEEIKKKSDEWFKQPAEINREFSGYSTETPNEQHLEKEVIREIIKPKKLYLCNFCDRELDANEECTCKDKPKQPPALDSEGEVKLTFDARTWAKGFNQTLVKLGYQPHDEGWLVSWFANAIMCGYDHHASKASPNREKVPLDEEKLAKEFYEGYIRDCKNLDTLSSVKFDLWDDLPKEDKMRMAFILRAREICAKFSMPESPLSKYEIYKIWSEWESIKGCSFVDLLSSKYFIFPKDKLEGFSMPDVRKGKK